MRAPWKAQEQITTELTGQKNGARPSRRDFLLYLGPALMVSLAYMDPGNYGTDLAAGAGFKYDLAWLSRSSGVALRGSRGVLLLNGIGGGIDPIDGVRWQNLSRPDVPLNS